MKQKVIVGLSGGVDSAVSALLLKKAGYDVHGVFINVWHPPFMKCANVTDRSESMRAAAELDIPWKEIHLEDAYKKHVVDYMVNEYKEGRVPNPDVMCNKFVKFGDFAEWAFKENASFLAFGHYAQTKNGELYKASDERKDQTYFLWNIDKTLIARTLFPIGHLHKDEVRKIAIKHNLSAGSRPDSQGLCFIGDINIKNFLNEFIEIKPGKVLDIDGKIIGDHEGAIIYTLGQRHGFTVLNTHNNTGAMYVINKNLKQNTITVSSKNPINSPSAVTELSCKNGNFFSNVPTEVDLECRIRHQGKLIKCKVSFVNSDRFDVHLNNPQVIDAGQSLVLYKNDKCLGGGIAQ